MAFCAITDQDRKSFGFLVVKKAEADISQLKNFKAFSKSIYDFLISKNASQEKAVALLSLLPELISHHSNFSPENRKTYRSKKISIDAIYDMDEEHFQNYDKLADFIGLGTLEQGEEHTAEQKSILSALDNLPVATFNEDKQRVLNGKVLSVRVTDIAVAGFKTPQSDEESAALVHGNTVDAIAKDVFNGVDVKYEDFKNRIDQPAFDTLVMHLNNVKKSYPGWAFRSGVTLFNEKLSLGGETDLIGIDPKGNIHIFDYKSGRDRMNDASFNKQPNLGVDGEIKGISKRQQYSTQGYVYSKMLSELLGKPVSPHITIIAIPIVYDQMDASQKITKVNPVEQKRFSQEDIRPEYKDKTLAEIVAEHEKLAKNNLVVPEEIKPKRQKKNFGISQEKEVLDRVASIKERAASSEELQKEIEDVLRIFGPETLIRLSDVVDANLFGQFRLDGITVFKNASRGTVYHEGWHNFSQLFLTKGEKVSLYTSLGKKAFDFTTRDGRTLNSKDASFHDLEEFMAEEFAKYALDPKGYQAPTKQAKTILQKIWEFLKKYFSGPSDFDYFKILYQGNLSSYTPSVNNAFWGKLNSTVSSNNQEIISNERFPLYKRTMDSLIDEELRAQGKSFTAFKQSKSLQKGLLENIRKELNNRYLAEDNEDPNSPNYLTEEQFQEFENIIGNYKEFINAYLKVTDYESLKDFAVDDDVFTSSVDELAAVENITNDYSDVEDVDEGNEDEDSKPDRELFDRGGNEQSAYSYADDAVKDFFTTVPKVKEIKNGKPVFQTNELGYRENHKQYDIFYKTKKMLEGAFTLDEILARLNSPSNQQKFPELAVIAERFQAILDNNTEQNKYRKIQNEVFIQSFTHAMELPHVNNMQLTVNFKALGNKKSRNTTSTYKKLFRSIALKIIKNWSKNFKDRRGKTPMSITTNSDILTINTKENGVFISASGKVMLNPFLDYNLLFRKSDVAGIKSFFDFLGFNLNDKIYADRDAMKLLTDTKLELLGQLDTVRKESLTKLAEEIGPAGPKLGKKSDDLKGILDSIDTSFSEDIARDYFIGDPVGFFSEQRSLPYTNDRTRALKFQFEKITAYEEMYGDLVSSGSFSIEGKTKYPFYIPSQLTLVTRGLNAINSEKDFAANRALSPINPLSRPWMKRSLFFKSMFEINGQTLERKKDKDGNPIEIVVEDISSYKEIDTDGVREVGSASLSKVDKLFFDMLTMVNTGAAEMPRAETSPTTFSIRLSAYGTQNLPVRQAAMSNYVNSDFQEALKQVFLAEVEKRDWFAANDPKNKLAGKFDVFEGVISAELKDKVWDLFSHPITPVKADDLFDQPFDEEKTIRQKFEEDTDKYFREREDELKPLFNKMTQDQKSILKDALGGNTDPSRSFVASTKTYSETRALKILLGNKFLLDAEYRNLMFGDYNYYKNPAKRGKSVVNTKTPMIVDRIRNERLNALQFQSLHSVATGKEKAPFKDFSLIKSGVIADVKMHSSYLGKDDASNMMLQDLINFFTSSGVITKDNREAKIQELKDNITSKYEKINIADGQGIIGLDFYRNFAIITKIWNAETHEKEYERQIAIYRRNTNKYGDLKDDALEQAKQRDRDLIAAGPFTFFNPLKISYTGPEATEGPLKPVFDKFSVRPILPETAVEGTRDAELLEQMLQRDVDYLKFESGTKASGHPATDWFTKLGEGQYDLKDFSVELERDQALYSTYLGHQLNTEAMKKETIFSSQFRKIVYDVMFTPAVRNSPEAVGYFSKQYDNYIDLVKEAINVEEKELFNLLGVQMKDGEYYIANFESFAKYLNEESIKRDLPINTRKYLQYNKDTQQFTYPLDFSFNRSEITNLISGLMDERLRRLKLNGTQAIQVSSAGFEKQANLFQKPTTEQIKQYGTNGLHYYHLTYDKDGNPTGTSTMGVKVGLTANFKSLLNLKHPDGQKIGTENKEESLARLNQAIANKEWKEEHKRKLTMVGYRIPVQNNNFIDHMEVMEFLPESVGSIIIPPIELIIKSGSDFDIDKLNILLPHLTKGGSLSIRGGKDINAINEALRQITFNINDYKKAQDELKDIKKRSDNTLSSLLSLQRKIRNTIQEAIIFEQSSKFLDAIDINAAEDVNEKNLDQYIEKTPNLDKSIIDFYTIDREIERLKKVYGDTEPQIDKDFEKLIQQKKELKGAIGNEIVKNLSETIGSAYYYPLLISPSTASMVDNIANNIVASTKDIQRGEGENLFDLERTPEENARYSTNLDTFDNFMGKRKDLGGFAIQRTWSSILAKTNFHMFKNFVTEKGDNFTIHTPLIPKASRSQVVKDGRILMSGQSVSGIPIRDTFDQLQSATIDIANSPAYPYIGVNKYNKAIFNFLIHQKVDPEVAVYFVNQPILMEAYDLFEKQSVRVERYTFKHALVQTALRHNMLREFVNAKGQPKYSDNIYHTEKRWNEQEERNEYVKIETKANDYLARPGTDANQYLSEDDEFTLEALDKAIRSKDKSSDFQKKVLAYFMATKERADDFSSVQFAYNTDTTKYSTLPTIIRNENSKRKVKENPVFDKAKITAIEEESMIGPFDYTRKAKKLLSTIYPILYNPEIVDTFSNILTNISGRNLELERYSKIIENDFIEFVYKNFGEYKGKNISDLFQPQVINLDNTADHRFMSDNLREIKQKYPELNDIPFVNGLDENAYLPVDEMETGYEINGAIVDGLEHRNIALSRSTENPTFEKDIFTNNWNNLINFSPEKLGIKKEYTPQQIREISGFFTDLVYFSLYQSGLTNTGDGFSDLIPFEMWAAFIGDAFTRFDTHNSKNDSNLNALLAAFERKSLQMNPRMPWRTTTEEIGKDSQGRIIRKPIPQYKNAYKGKDYRVTNESLGYKAFEEDGIYVIQQEPETEIPTVELGRYVTYNGETYMVVKKNPSGTWQIYAPNKSGRDAKKSVAERNLTATKDKGRVVSYNSGNYIVTPNNTIISLTTNRVMAWAENDPQRKGVLSSKEAPLGDPKLDNNELQDCEDAPF